MYICTTSSLSIHLFVKQSEVNQKEKNKYHILTHDVESRKVVQMNLFAGKEQRCIRREQMCGPRAREEGAMNWETGVHIRAWPCVEWMASGNLLSDTGSSGQCWLVA